MNHIRSRAARPAPSNAALQATVAIAIFALLAVFRAPQQSTCAAAQTQITQEQSEELSRVWKQLAQAASGSATTHSARDVEFAGSGDDHGKIPSSRCVRATFSMALKNAAARRFCIPGYRRRVSRIS